MSDLLASLGRQLDWLLLIVVCENKNKFKWGQIRESKVINPCPVPKGIPFSRQAMKLRCKEVSLGAWSSEMSGSPKIRSLCCLSVTPLVSGTSSKRAWKRRIFED